MGNMFSGKGDDVEIKAGTPSLKHLQNHPLAYKQKNCKFPKTRPEMVEWMIHQTLGSQGNTRWPYDWQQRIDIQNQIEKYFNDFGSVFETMAKDEEAWLVFVIKMDNYLEWHKMEKEEIEKSLKKQGMTKEEISNYDWHRYITVNGIKDYIESILNPDANDVPITLTEGFLCKKCAYNCYDTMKEHINNYIRTDTKLEAKTQQTENDRTVCISGHRYVSAPSDYYGWGREGHPGRRLAIEPQPMEINSGIANSLLMLVIILISLGLCFFLRRSVQQRKASVPRRSRQSVDFERMTNLL